MADTLITGGVGREGDPVLPAGRGDRGGGGGLRGWDAVGVTDRGA